jgi:SAM-dependent methyltransferase
MKMSKVEKIFVNSSSHSAQVSKHAEQLLRRINFQAGQGYLDFGCGNGAAPIYLARQYGLKVTGVDVDPAQIQAAEEQSFSMDNVRFCTLDGRELPFDDGEFDIVATNKVMHHIPNWQGALAEMVRVLRPDGYLIYSDLVYPRWLAAFASALVKHHAGFPTKIAIEAQAREHRLRKLYFSPSAVQVEAIFQR